MPTIKVALFASALFAVIFLQAASAQTVSTLPPDNYLNGAGFFATGDKNIGALSPCSIATFFMGTPLTAASRPVRPNLYGAAIQELHLYALNFNSEAAPILSQSFSAAQTVITFQVPCDVQPGSVVVSYAISGEAIVPRTYNTTLDIRSASPGIFEIPMSDGVRRAVAARSDGTFVSLRNPAHRGENIRLYITGLGPLSPPLTTNALPTPGVDSVSTAAYVAMVLGSNNRRVPVLSARASPSLIGVDELQFKVPTDAPTGNDVFIEVGVLVTNSGNFQFANPGVGSKIPIR